MNTITIIISIEEYLRNYIIIIIEEIIIIIINYLFTFMNIITTIINIEEPPEKMLKGGSWGSFLAPLVKNFNLNLFFDCLFKSTFHH